MKLLVDDHGLEGHEVQFGALELIVVFFGAILAQLILEDKGQLLFVVDGEVVLLIELAGPDDVQKIAEFYLHYQGVIQCHHVVVDLFGAAQETVSQEYWRILDL